MQHQLRFNNKFCQFCEKLCYFVISGKFELCRKMLVCPKKFWRGGWGGEVVKRGGGRSSKIIFSGKIYNEIHSNQMDKRNCLQTEAGAKKLFATTTTPKKIVCVDEMSIPPLQKNNGPSLIFKLKICLRKVTLVLIK